MLTPRDFAKDPDAYTDLARRAGLNERERAVLDLMKKGKSTKEIARNLRLSEKTIRTYSTVIVSKITRISGHNAFFDVEIGGFSDNLPSTPSDEGEFLLNMPKDDSATRIITETPISGVFQFTCGEKKAPNIGILHGTEDLKAGVQALSDATGIPPSEIVRRALFAAAADPSLLVSGPAEALETQYKTTIRKRGGARAGSGRKPTRN